MTLKLVHHQAGDELFAVDDIEELEQYVQLLNPACVDSSLGYRHNNYITIFLPSHRWKSALDKVLT